MTSASPSSQPATRSGMKQQTTLSCEKKAKDKGKGRVVLQPISKPASVLSPVKRTSYTPSQLTSISAGPSSIPSRPASAVISSSNQPLEVLSTESSITPSEKVSESSTARRDNVSSNMSLAGGQDQKPIHPIYVSRTPSPKRVKALEELAQESDTFRWAIEHPQPLLHKIGPGLRVYDKPLQVSVAKFSMLARIGDASSDLLVMYGLQDKS